MDYKTKEALFYETDSDGKQLEWLLFADLEKLKEGKGEEAIWVELEGPWSDEEQHNKVNGEIIRIFGLADGVKVSALQEILDDIVARADEVTDAFYIEGEAPKREGKWKREDPLKSWNFWYDLFEELEDLECLEKED